MTDNEILDIRVHLTKPKISALITFADMVNKIELKIC